MKHALLPLFLAAAVLAPAQTATKSTAAPKSTTSTKKITPTTKAAPKSAGNLLDPASLNATAPASYRVLLTTTQGPVLIEVTRAWAPRGADRFYNLVRAGYFTDAPFFRVVPRFMAQFGINARPEVNRAWEHTNIKDDPNNGKSNKRGMVTFATTGAPNTRATQLFINLVDNAYLDPQGFIPFGEVVEGMENVDKFYTGYGDTANKEDVIAEGGKAYVDRNMPKLDRILTAKIAPAAAPAASKAAPTAAPAAK